MFDILEADIVCFQEVKTPKASLTDDLVFVDGWDTFYSFPHSLTGYSGVAVYTRDSKCVPLRVEEGVTGILKIPGTQTRYVDAPPDKQIGGYPTDRQLRRAAVGRDVIDSEGRCLILEFPLFVLINVYCPARRNHERTGYRNTFLLALDVRIRNLAAEGKNVVLCGDLNIMRDQLDTAGIWGHGGIKVLAEALEFDENYMTMRAPKLLSQLLFNSRTISDTGTPFIDETTETRRPPVLYDTCRELHPDRTGMFTCWDTRKNHRPANFGSRIDLIMCSPKVMQLVQEANIQPHLLGSDHCPVYVVLQEAIGDDDAVEAGETAESKDMAYTLDYLNPPGRFVDGHNVLPPDEDTALLKKRFPQSGRRMPQFSNRRHIASMFQRASKPAAPTPVAQDQKSSAHPAAADTSVQPSTPELPAILKAEAVELVESDFEGDDGAGMIEDEEEDGNNVEDTDDANGAPGTVEEDERFEYVARSGAVSKMSKTQQPTDLPQASIKDNEGRGSQKKQRPPPLHANEDALSSVVPSVVSPSLPSRPLPLTAADENQNGGVDADVGVSETSAVHGCRSQTPSTDLPFERGRSKTPIVESSTSTSERKPNQMQSFWGDRSGVDVSRERGNTGASGESGEAEVALAPPPLTAPSLASPPPPPKPKTALPASQSATPSLLPSSTTTATRRSLARSQSGASNSSTANTANASLSSSSARPAKKAKTSANSSSSASTGIQMSMNMFLTARPAKEKEEHKKQPPPVAESTPVPQSQPSPSPSTAVASALDEANTAAAADNEAAEWMTAEEVDAAFKNLDAAKASWSRLGLGQRQAPLCEHGEPCKTFVTKKAGVNSGRSFYMCARPPGPLGKKEKGTAWQCTTFVWCRDWRPDRTE
ncbi:Class II abasic (AP) endonuclease [Sporothrix stenoceras]